MPVYTYDCEGCGLRFDQRMGIREKESGFKPTCPQCGCPDTTQVFTGFMILSSRSSDNPMPPGCIPSAGCC